MSKLLIVFLQPLTWIILSLAFALALGNSRLKKRFTLASLLILLLFSNAFLLNCFAHWWDVKDYPDLSKPYSCAILLGGFASEGPERLPGHFNSSADRFLETLRLYKLGKVNRILISGGNASVFKRNFVEADFVRRRLLELGVPDSCILVEDKSKNTYQNAAFSKVILKKKKLLPPYLLVSSAFHLRRAVQTFESAGMTVVPCPSDYKADLRPTRFVDFVPDADVLALWNNYIKEMVGYWVYQLRTQVQKM